MAAKVEFFAGSATAVLAQRDEFSDDARILSRLFHLKKLIQEVDLILPA